VTQEGIVTSPLHALAFGGRPALPGLVARRTLACALLLAALGASGCLVGPDFKRPEAPVSSAWLGAATPAVLTDELRVERWWDVFGDPALSVLVEQAFRENLTLRSAGLRVIQAQARRGIAIGLLFPQQQALGGGITYEVRSENTAAGALAGRNVADWRAGLDAAWELDLWGRFRRNIEASDAELLGAVATYDDVLVSLVAEVATTYLDLRRAEEQLAVARDNVTVQEESLRIARVRFEAGGTSDLDVAQAEALLRDTEAAIPEVETRRREALDSLSVLLGMPPQDLTALVGAEPGRVPEAPLAVAVGVPVELLRRRPDVRAAELAAAAQSARIGVAAADLLPAFQLNGSIGLDAERAAHFFEGKSFAALGGPSFSWPILNYGRIVNDVRLQDALFEETLTRYADTVLVAQREVEDALAGYLHGLERVQLLAAGASAANRAVDISLIQYRAGATDYTAVLNSQQSKLRLDSQLVASRADVATSVVALYRALGGGWELREGLDFVPQETRAAMAKRTRWGGLISPEARSRDVDEAAADAAPRPWWHWRTWWPRW